MSENLSPAYQKFIVCFVTVFLIGAFLGSHFEQNKFSNFLKGFITKRIDSDPFKLVSPLVGIESPSALTVGEFSDIHGAIINYANKNKDKVDSYSVYYRDLNSSLWFGINETDGYIPASLLKTALALAFLKQEEIDPSLKKVSKVYTYSIAQINKSVPFLDPTGLVVGRAYSTQELLEKMLIDSDNGAKDLLYSELDKGYFYKIFSLIGIEQPSDALKYTLSTKDFALFFRVLYGGTYLTLENSERMLEILTRTKFNDGLVAGVPRQITVAHKYGTFTLTDKNGGKIGIELHDCGIIYHQLRPYVLCVMTKGQDANKLASFIAGISSIVYQDVEADSKE